MADSHKAKEQGHAEQGGGSVVITSHESLGHGEFFFCLNQSQPFLSVKWGRLLFTLKKASIGLFGYTN